MAPVDRIDHDAIERTSLHHYRITTTAANSFAEQLKDVIQDFYRIMVQVSTYDSMGRSSKEVLSNEMYQKPHPPATAMRNHHS